jgi:hypothetical protein
MRWRISTAKIRFGVLCFPDLCLGLSFTPYSSGFLRGSQILGEVPPVETSLHIRRST